MEISEVHIQFLKNKKKYYATLSVHLWSWEIRKAFLNIDYARYCTKTWTWHDIYCIYCIWTFIWFTYVHIWPSMRAARIKATQREFSQLSELEKGKSTKVLKRYSKLSLTRLEVSTRCSPLNHQKCTFSGRVRWRQTHPGMRVDVTGRARTWEIHWPN